MKTSRAILAALLLFGLPTWADDEPAVAVLLQKGLYAEQTEGNLRSAIDIYQDIVARADINRTFIARAQFRLGACHRKLGEKDAAVAAFRRVVDQFPDQRELVLEAQRQLVELDAQPAKLTLQRIATPEGGLYAVSRDGRLGAVLHGPPADLAVYDLSTYETRVLVKAEKRDGPWAGWLFSPDARFLAYIWIGEPSLRITSLADPAPRILLVAPEGGWIELADWAPDGTQILVEMTRKDKRAVMALVDVKDGTLRELKEISEGTLGRMQFSPDGKWIAYRPTMSPGKEAPGLMLLECSTGREITVLAGHDADSVVGWLPKGRTLLYVRKRVDESDLWAIDLREPSRPGAPRLVKQNFRAEPLIITDAGELYCVEKGRSAVELNVARVDFAAGKTLESPKSVAPKVQGVKSTPVWSPDGRRLGFSLDQQVAFATWSRETGEVRQYPLSRTLKRALTNTRWSPDGAFVFGWSTSQEGDFTRFRLDLDSGKITAVHPPSVADSGNRRTPSWHACFGPDAGAFFYLCWEKRGANGEQFMGQVVHHDLSTHQEKVVVEWEKPWVHGPFEVSPDGKWCCLVSRSDKSRVVLKAMEGPESRELFTADAWVLSLRWTPDGKRVVYALASNWEGDSKSEVWSRPIDGSAPVKLDLGLPSVRLLSIHPDNERVAFQSGGREADEVWVMRNLLLLASERSVP